MPVGEAGEGRGPLPPEDAERLAVAIPRIYVASLADYNNGELHGAWIDADQDPEELQAEIDTMLARSTEETAEEWAIHDYEGFGDFRLSECESLQVVSAVALGIAEYGLAFAAYAANFGTGEEELAAFQDCFLGHWPSREAHARDMAEDFQWEEALRNLPEDMRPYARLDYQAIAEMVDNAMTVVEDGSGGIYLFGER